jgi:hypothetical protein
MQGIRSEKKILRILGARRHAMSGAGSIKYDGSDEDTVYEIKDANKVFPLDGKYLRDGFHHAARQSKDFVLVVYFTDSEVTAYIKVRKGRVERW